MSNQVRADSLATLQEQWQHWTTVVESIVRHRSGLHLNGFQNYRQMHEALLQSCRAQARGAEGNRKLFFQSLEETASPWMSPEILARTDAEVLQKLLTRCRVAEQELGCHKETLSVWHWLAVATVAIAAACMVSLTQLDPEKWPLVRQAQHGIDLLWSLVARTTILQRFVTAGVMVVLVSIYLIRRAGRV